MLGRGVSADDVTGVINTGDAKGDININVYQNQPLPPESRWYATVLVRVDNDFALLRWNSRAVKDLIGRDAEMVELCRWTGDGPAVQARLICGAGGVGKTRLAADLAADLVGKGWRVEVLNRDGTPQTLPINKEGLLLIADYPEERMQGVEALLARLADHVTDTTYRIRVLLLSRKNPNWWKGVEERTGADALFLADPIILAPATGGDVPETLFRAALAGLTGLTEAPSVPSVATAEFAGWQARNQAYMHPLYLTALALQCLREPVGALSLSAPEIFRALARREQTRAERAGEAIGPGQKTLPRLLALATIKGGLGEEDLDRLSTLPGLCIKPGESGSRIDRIAHLPWVMGQGVMPLEPDLPAAAFIALCLCPTGEPAAAGLWPVIQPDPMGAFKRLDRLCHDMETVLKLFDPTDPQRLSARLVAMVAGQVDRCLALEPVTRTLEFGHLLSPVQVAIAQGLLLQPDLPQEQRATILNNLSVHLGAMGQANKALEAIREAVNVCRDSAHSDPAQFNPVLAGRLLTLSSRLADAGEAEEALRAIREAVELFRELARISPVQFNPKLASSLNNLSSCLGVAGKPSEALDASRESVVIRRDLASSDPARFNHDLARSLHNLSTRLGETGKAAAALETICAAVELFRALARTSPARFNPELGRTLGNQAVQQRAMGDQTGALASVREALPLVQPVAMAFPDGPYGRVLRGLQAFEVELTRPSDPQQG